MSRIAVRGSPPGGPPPGGTPPPVGSPPGPLLPLGAPRTGFVAPSPPDAVLRLSYPEGETPAGGGGGWVSISDVVVMLADVRGILPFAKPLRTQQMSRLHLYKLLS